MLTDEGDHLDLVSLPGVVWDARVGVHRVPPYRAAALVAELRTKGVRVTDETASSVLAARGGSRTEPKWAQPARLQGARRANTPRI